MYNKEIESLPLEKLRKLQSERLQSMLKRQYTNVPFYKKTYDEAGININEIRRIEDIHKLPFTLKTDLRDNYPYRLSAVPESDFARIHASSGTTGRPTVVTYTKNDLEVFSEVVARSLYAAGARPGMKIHNAYGYGLFTGGLGIHGGAEKMGLAVIPVSGGMTERQLTILQDFKPDIITCTPSYGQTLAEKCRERGIDASKLHVKYAIIGAEPWTEAVRKDIETGLDLQATNIYGLSEIIGPGVSQEDVDEKGTGSYIWEDHFYPEIVDRDTKEPLPYGEEGVLVFTTLTKEAMPFCRYWTNDICTLHYDPNGKRSHVKMGDIKGRADDMLIIRGVNLFHTQVESVIETVPNLAAQYQLIVSNDGGMDKVSVKVEKDSTLQQEYSKLSSTRQSEIDRDLQQSLQSSIKDTIGLSMSVEVVNSGDIPRSAGGKLSRIVDQR